MFHAARFPSTWLSGFFPALQVRHNSYEYLKWILIKPGCMKCARDKSMKLYTLHSTDRALQPANIIFTQQVKESMQGQNAPDYRSETMNIRYIKDVRLGSSCGGNRSVVVLLFKLCPFSKHCQHCICFKHIYTIVVNACMLNPHRVDGEELSLTAVLIVALIVI